MVRRRPVGTLGPIDAANRLPDDPARAPARLGWRIGGRLVDVVVVGWVAAFVVVEVLGRLLGGDPLARRPAALDVRIDTTALVALALVVVALEVAPVARRGASLGKAALGLRVVRVDTWGRPGALRSGLRAATLYLPLAVPVVGPLIVVVVALPALVWPTRRGLHDVVAGTAVVEVPRDGPAHRSGDPTPDPGNGGPRP
jgi:uncharacterized RDD family membrane protein YckC